MSLKSILDLVTTAKEIDIKIAVPPLVSDNHTAIVNLGKISSETIQFYVLLTRSKRLGLNLEHDLATREFAREFEGGSAKQADIACSIFKTQEAETNILEAIFIYCVINDIRRNGYEVPQGKIEIDNDWNINLIERPLEE